MCVDKHHKFTTSAGKAGMLIRIHNIRAPASARPADWIHPEPCLPGRRRIRPAEVYGDSPPPAVS